MRLRANIVAIAISLLALACRAPAPESELALQWGTFGVGGTEQIFLVGAEYRPEAPWKGLRPIVGVSELEDGAEYFYAAARYDIDIRKRLQLFPSFAPGHLPGRVRRSRGARRVPLGRRSRLPFP